MGQIPAFLSLIIVARNQARSITPVLEEAASQLSNLVSDFELVVIDNGSNDDSIEVLKVLTGDRGFPNLQVYVLTKEVDRDIASWVGLESAQRDHHRFVDMAYPVCWWNGSVGIHLLCMSALFGHVLQLTRPSVGNPDPADSSRRDEPREKIVTKQLPSDAKSPSLGRD